MRLHSYQPQEVAEELCLMDAELLRKIGPKELENGAWMKQDKVGVNGRNWLYGSREHLEFLCPVLACLLCGTDL